MARAQNGERKDGVSLAEDDAWRALRQMRNEGVHVVRQHRIGRYTVDFAIRRLRIAIEIDGGVHNLPGRAARDALRDEALSRLGWRVLHFPARLAHDPNRLIDAVRAALAPSPGGEGAGGGVVHDRREFDREALGRGKVAPHPAPLPPPLQGRRSAAKLRIRRMRASRVKAPRGQCPAPIDGNADLRQKIARTILETGPMSVAAFMGACLNDPEYGYYATRPAIGGAGADFLTAPEASQMFGELIGLWAAHHWSSAMGAPCPVHLIELGPGSGALMADALRAARVAPAFFDAAQVTFVETSAPLRAAQKAKVPGARWAQSLQEAPQGPCIIIANEFLDCLPIRQFVRTPEGWREKLVGVDDQGALAFGLGAVLALAAQITGDVYEMAPALPAFMSARSEHMHANAPAAGLFIDYGSFAPEGADTLQALRAHAKEHPLATPGEADLTAHVDFSAVRQLGEAAGLEVAFATTQAEFLRGLGIEARAEALARANPERGARIARETHRLTAQEEMGDLFKVICFTTTAASGQS